MEEFVREPGFDGVRTPEVEGRFMPGLEGMRAPGAGVGRDVEADGMRGLLGALRMEGVGAGRPVAGVGLFTDGEVGRLTLGEGRLTLGEGRFTLGEDGRLGAEGRLTGALGRDGADGALRIGAGEGRLPACRLEHANSSTGRAAPRVRRRPTGCLLAPVS
jgi:hypothetical protein